MDWKEVAARLKFQDKVSWTQLPEALKKETGLDLHKERVRKALRKHPLYKEQPEITDLNGAILKSMEKERSKKELCETFKISDRILTAVLEDLKEGGFLINEDGDTIKLCKDLIPQDNIFNLDWRGNKIIRFGLCGDNQHNSKYTQITHLHDFYDICESEGIETVYHTGDIDEGEEMRVGHKYECYTQGADDHVREIVNTYPKRKGIKTEFITGNHDHSLIKRAGYDIGYAIQTQRQDMIYLGKSNARIYLTPNCILELHHPIDGTAYAISYKTQKMIEAMQGGEKPNILAIGHYHKTEYLFYRNIHAFQTGCFQAQTPWMKGKQIAAHVGGWIIEVRVDDEGTISRCTGTFIPYYKMIKDDYKNWI